MKLRYLKEWAVEDLVDSQAVARTMKMIRMSKEAVAMKPTWKELTPSSHSKLR